MAKVRQFSMQEEPKERTGLFGDQWKIEKKGQSIVGVYVGADVNQEKGVLRRINLINSAGKFNVGCGAVLATKMKGMKIGTAIFIVYLGKKKGAKENSEYRDYKLFSFPLPDDWDIQKDLLDVEEFYKNHGDKLVKESLEEDE